MHAIYEKVLSFANSYAERWIQSDREECLNKLLNVSVRKHPNHY